MVDAETVQQRGMQVVDVHPVLHHLETKLVGDAVVQARLDPAARERPEVPILGLSAERTTARQLSMVWGVHCVHTTDIQNLTGMVEKACDMALAEGFGKVGDRMVITAGIPFGRAGTTNILRIAKIGSEGGDEKSKTD